MNLCHIYYWFKSKWFILTSGKSKYIAFDKRRKNIPELKLEFTNIIREYNYIHIYIYYIYLLLNLFKITKINNSQY